MYTAICLTEVLGQCAAGIIIIYFCVLFSARLTVSLLCMIGSEFQIHNIPHVESHM